MKPDLDGGAIRERNGNRFFVRLWPQPVILRADHFGAWRAVEDVCDDFNLSVLVDVRDELAARFARDYPTLTTSVVQGQEFIEGVALPAELQPLQRIQRRIEARQRAMRVIPADVLNLVRRFPEAHFALLQLFSAYPEAVELAETHPVLAYLLATSGCGSPNDVHRMLRSKRTAILRGLGFGANSRSIVRLLGKIQPGACRGKLVSALRHTMQDEGITRRLRHLPTINLGCLAVAADKTPLNRISNGVLCDIVEDPHENRHSKTALKLRACLMLERKGFLSGLPRVFHRRSKLESMLVSRAEYLSPEEIEALGLEPAPPPLPDTGHIRALRTAEDVYAESCDQCNCVWTLLPQLVSGKLFIYRVLAPERATVAIQPSRGGFGIQELEGPWNSSVSTETHETVQRWLDAANAAHCHRDNQMLFADHEEAG